MNEALYEFYNVPQTGGSLPVFQGSKRHLAGGGFFGTLARFALPILKSIGKRAIGAAVRGGTQYLSGEKKFLPAMQEEFAGEAVNLAHQGISNINKRIKKKLKGGGGGIGNNSVKRLKQTIFDKRL